MDDWIDRWVIHGLVDGWQIGLGRHMDGRKDR